MCRKLLLIVLLLFSFIAEVRAQTLTDRKVTLQCVGQPVKRVLQLAGEQGHFYFSYNSDILKGDSLVTIAVRETPVKDVLKQVLGPGYMFNIHGNYIIIRRAAPSSLVLTGVVKDAVTGLPIADATVYSREQLRSVFTEPDGGYSLKLKGEKPPEFLGAGRVGYRDTTVRVYTGGDSLLLYLSPENKAYDSIIVSSAIPHSWTGRLLLSSKQRLRTLNLRHLFTQRSFQLSLVPGLSTRGKMSGQVESNLSLNILGGYTAGVKGAEIGGLFNLNRGSAGYLQVAGLLNATGGSFTGLQAAMGHNIVRDTLKGVQAAFLLNYARINRGLQVGLINASDYSDGISLGLLNFVKDGSRRLTVYSSDLINTMIAYKTGNRHFYNILLAGNNTNGKAISTLGVGMGYNYAPFIWTSLSGEVNYQLIKLDSWKNRLMQAKLLLNFYPLRSIGVFGGPVYNHYINADRPEDYMKNPISLEEFVQANLLFRKAVKNWVGWEAGLSFETARLRVAGAKRSGGWSVAPGFSLGREYHSSRWMPGGDISVQKDFSSTISVLLSGGYTMINDDAGVFLLASVKFFAAGPFYVAGIMGHVAGLSIASSAVTGLSAGFQLPGGADFSAGYEHFHGLHIEQLQLRGRYHFRLFK